MIILEKIFSPIQTSTTSLLILSHDANKKNDHTPMSPSSFSSSGGMILACSMSREHQKLFYSTTLSARHICADRQGILDHLYPKRLLKSTLKVSITQTAHIFSKYMTDQIREDMERDEKVEKGILTREQADEESERWQQLEWKIRFEELPRKLMVALSKYHAVILTMRLYEWIASKVVNEEMMDKLTIDTFLYAKRKSEVEAKKGTELAREMYSVSWRANLISFLADYSVHQVIMLYAYYCYAQKRRKRITEDQEDSVTSVESFNDDMPQGHLILSAVRKSTLLGLSRGIALGLSSVGAGLGSMVTPAWGTLIGTNLGDGLAASLTEDLVDYHF